MPVVNRVVLYVAGLLWLTAAAPAQRIPVVRVGLVSVGSASKMAVSAEEPFALMRTQGGEVLQSWKAGERVLVEAAGAQVVIGGHRLAEAYFSTSGDRLKLYGPAVGRKYRGWLHFSARAGVLTPVNEVALETYLMGVVPCEMSPSAPMEALKAQAVAARTYTLRKIGSLAGVTFDVDDTTRCHTYKGADAEAPRSNEAVRLTSNQVLLYDGKPIEALYATVSGGVTASAAEAFRSAGAPYLQSLRDLDERGEPFAKDSKWMQWSLQLNPTLATELLTKAGVNVGSVSEIEVVGKSASGRVSALRVSGSFATVDLPGADLRRIFGPDVLRSTLFDVARETDGWTFTGRGWGHGVGMCQAGAVGRALAGQGFEQILSAYYPGTQLIQVRNSPIELSTRGSWVERKKFDPGTR